MPVKIAMIVCLCALMLISLGCAGQETVTPPKVSYRTVTTGPLRNTEAAREANQRGLEHLHAGEIAEAGTAFRQAVERDIEFGPAHNNLGKVYYLQKDWYKAAWEFEYARKQMPRRAEPRNNLGLVLERAGELDNAVNYYREAVSLAPDDIHYRANLARALIRRGDRTPEVFALLRQILDQDTRPAWLIWAKQQLGREERAAQE